MMNRIGFGSPIPSHDHLTSQQENSCCGVSLTSRWNIEESRYGCHSSWCVLLPFPSSIGWCCPFWVVLFSPSLFLGGAAFLHLLCVVRFPLFLRLGAAFTSSSFLVHSPFKLLIYTHISLCVCSCVGRFKCLKEETSKNSVFLRTNTRKRRREAALPESEKKVAPPKRSEEEKQHHPREDSTTPKEGWRTAAPTQRRRR